MSTHATASESFAAFDAGGPRLQEDKDDVLLWIRVKPRARADAIEGVRNHSPLVCVAAAPSVGEANARVIEVLSRASKLSKNRVSIACGAASRDQTIRLSQISLQEAQTRLAAL